jgi:hypothetical protein
VSASDSESPIQPDPGSAQPDPAAAAVAAASSADIVQLLVKAVGMLPDGERDQVYTWLMHRGFSTMGGTAALPVRLREVSSQLLSLQTAGGSPGAQTAQQVVPVRFTAEQHAQLRSWCAEHGFSMATVIRGLVARFLEGQLPARN